MTARGRKPRAGALTSTLSVRLTRDERAALEDRAAILGVSVGALLRRGAEALWEAHLRRARRRAEAAARTLAGALRPVDEAPPPVDEAPPPA